MIGKAALVLIVAAAGVLGLWVMTGIAATMGITALLNAYPRKGPLMNTTRRPTAPDIALKVRTAAALSIVAAYAVFRLPTLVAPWEAVLTWVGALACGAIALSSLEELGLRRHFRTQPIEKIREAVDEAPTQTFAVPMRWPDEVELAIADSRHETLIDHGEIVEPRLFTHEYNPLTPPHGIEMVPAGKCLDDDVRVSAVEILQRLTEGGWVPKDTPARHAAQQLARDRTGQLFGGL